jgi:hypothetical protein
MLSESDRDLLKRMGLDVDKLLKQAKRERRVNDKPKPVNVVRDHESIMVIYHCICCTRTTTSYKDLIARADCDGYCLRSVDVPSFPVTMTQRYDVYDCPECEDDILDNYGPVNLAEMIKNLRAELRKGIQR